MTILLAWLARLILVAGNTGSGKTTFLISLLFQLLVAGCRVWATEPYKRTLRHLRSVAHRIGSEVIVLRAQDWQVNLLEPWTGDPRDHLAMIIDLLVRVLGLPPRSRTIILQGSHALYEQFGVWDGREDAFPTLYDLYEWVWGRPDLNLPAREAILDRLGAFLAALTPACGAYRVGWNPVDLARYSIVHELAGTAPSDLPRRSPPGDRWVVRVWHQPVRIPPKTPLTQRFTLLQDVRADRATSQTSLQPLDYPDNTAHTWVGWIQFPIVSPVGNVRILVVPG